MKGEFTVTHKTPSRARGGRGAERRGAAARRSAACGCEPAAPARGRHNGGGSSAPAVPSSRRWLRRLPRCGTRPWSGARSGRAATLRSASSVSCLPKEKHVDPKDPNSSERFYLQHISYPGPSLVCSTLSARLLFFAAKASDLHPSRKPSMASVG